MTSGYDEDCTQSVTVLSFVAKSLPTSNAIDDYTILLLITGLCTAILVILVVLLLCVCMKTNVSRRHTITKSAPLASKSTSTTGLNEKKITENEFVNKKQPPTDIDNNTNFKKHLNANFASSNPALYSEQSNQKNGQLKQSSPNNNKHAFHHKDISANPHFQPVTCPDCSLSEKVGMQELVPFNQHDEIEMSAIPLLNMSDDVSKPKNTTVDLENHDVEKFTNKNFIQAAENNIVCSESSLSEHSFMNSDHGTSSLPLDYFNRSKAWFVPLDDLHHTPVRHSFLDTTNRRDDPLVNKASRNFSTKLITPPTIADGESSCSNDVNTDINHRELGVGLLSSSSNNFEKKSTAWDQREERPVVCIESKVNF